MPWVVSKAQYENVCSLIVAPQSGPVKKKSAFPLFYSLYMGLALVIILVLHTCSSTERAGLDAWRRHASGGKTCSCSFGRQISALQRATASRSEEHTSELQSPVKFVLPVF